MSPKLVIAGGGTGGHIFPGIAVAEEWQRRGGELVFVGTRQGQEKDLVPRHGFRVEFLKVGRLKGAGLIKKMLTVLKLPLSLVSAGRLLRREQAQIVLGIGGYASGPACLSAWVQGIKTAVLDQNILPGFTNRILGKMVHRVFLSFDKNREYFPARKVIVTGNPVRTSISATPYAALHEKMVIFVFGGSQGAVTLNKIFTGAVAQLGPLKGSLVIYHQAGAHDENELREFYKKSGVQATVQRFFDNMNELYAVSHLLICRAGAGTLTELALSGRPAILVPYPFAADDHQKKNAEYFVERDAAWMIEQKDLQAAGLAKMIGELWTHPEQLAQRAKNMAKLGIRDAAKKIVDELWQLIGEQPAHV